MLAFAAACTVARPESVFAQTSTAPSFEGNDEAVHPPGWRLGGRVGLGVLAPRTCDRCPTSAGRGLTFGLELSAPLAPRWQLTLAADARLMGYGRGATSTIGDLSLSAQHWPSWGRLSGGGNFWLRGGAAFASLSTSLGEEVNAETGQVVQFRRLGPGLVLGAGYELPHRGPWAFEFSLHGLVASFEDAAAVSAFAAFGVIWH